MHNWKEKFTCLGFSLTATFLISLRILGEKLFKLNSIQWDNSGDGFKNYFNFAWHYNYGKGMHYEGMLYPYGEYLPYTDAQPAVLLFFKFLKTLGINFEGRELFLVQVLPLLGLALGIYFLIRIFRHFGTPLVFALLFGLLVAALSPQLYRMQSHYSLSYVAIIPGFWYWYLKLKEQGRISLVLFTIGLLLTGYIHPYLLLMLFLFFLCLIGVESYQERKLNYKMLFSTVTAFILFMIINKLLDSIEDRPTNPIGKLSYKTEVSDLFPFYGHFNSWAGDLLKFRTEFFEGYCYLGILFFLVPVIYLIRRKSVQKFSMPKEASQSLFASLPLILMALGVHYLIAGELIYDLLPPLKQFRSLGRLSWPFYYVGLVFLFVYFFNTFKYYKGFKILLVVISLIYVYDAWYYQGMIKANIDQYHSDNMLYKVTPLKNILEEKGRSAEEFQAILALPSGTEGMEKLYLKHDWHTKTRSMHLSFQSGLPSTNVISSRTSISNVLKINQLTSSPMVYKELLNDLESAKPFLTVVNLKDSSLYHNVIDQSRLLGQYNETLVFETALSAFNAIPVSISDNPDGSIFYAGYDDQSCFDGMFSKSALCFDGEQVIADIKLDTSYAQLTFSIWYKIQKDRSNVPVFNIELYDSSRNLITSISYRDLDFKKVEVVNDWIGIHKSLEIVSNVSNIIWKVNGEQQVMDHALILPDGNNIQRKLDNEKYFIDGYISSQ